MERVYFPGPITGARAEISGQEAHHLARVRRAGQGMPVELFDGKGSVFVGKVERVDRHRVEVVIEARRPPKAAPPVSITLATAVPKGDRFDWLVEKATELGVSRIVPIRTARSVVDPRSSKLERLRRVVVEACKQSGRDLLLTIADPTDWDQLLADPGSGTLLIAHPGGTRIAGLEPIREATIAIGPEGGFDDEEIARGLSSGATLVSLGPNILRIETAALAASAAMIASGEAQEVQRPSDRS
jgi:16S rRNA (uracil1498-N3)-methyltransferase